MVKMVFVHNMKWCVLVSILPVVMLSFFCGVGVQDRDSSKIKPTGVRLSANNSKHNKLSSRRR